jgi:hypothetical protein
VPTTYSVPLADLLSHPKSIGGVLVSDKDGPYIACRGQANLFITLPNDFTEGLYGVSALIKAAFPGGGTHVARMYRDGANKGKEFYPQYENFLRLQPVNITDRYRAGMEFRLEIVTPGALIRDVVFSPVGG